LYDFQKKGADWLAGQRNALLADEMGLGKTAQAIVAAQKIGAEKILVLCPAVARINWVREFKRWGGITAQAALTFKDRPRSNVYVLGYPALSEKDHPLRAAVLKHEWDLLICDEAHWLKGPSERTKAVYGKEFNGGPGSLVAQADRVWLLSGTPMPNHAGELYSHLRALQPQRLAHPHFHRPLTEYEWQDRFCNIRDSDYGRRIAGSRNIPVLKKLLEGWVLRRRKAEVLTELPSISIVNTVLSGTVNKAILAEIEHELRTILNCPSDDVEAVVSALKAAAVHMGRIRRLTGLLKAPLVADHAQTILDGGEPKVIVFVHHLEVAETLRKALLNYHPVVLTGQTSAAARQTAIDSFQGDPEVRVFIGQITAAGTAITLTAAKHVLMAEADWVPANNWQAMSRAHRIGQQDGVLVEFLSIPDSIDEAISEVLTRKARDFAAIFD
jgi:SWI/SNF-related matrix-associated actin-dependent regulator 1 of chromatin subfamily A